MNRKFKITLHRGEDAACHVVSYLENELPRSVRISGDERKFLRPDGNPVSFTNVHQDQLAAAVKHQSEESGAEGAIEEVTGSREFQIMLSGNGFTANYQIVYHSGNEIPVVTSPAPNEDIPLPDGSKIPFERLRAADLKSFVSSMAKSNGLNFEFVDPDE
ncbi:MAG: hypothetical protein ABIT37_23795 [Luteolibacter sp.]